MKLQESSWFHFFIEHSLSSKQAVKLTEYAVNLESNSVPIIFEIEHLSKLLGIELSLVSRMAGANSYFYRRFYLKKRTGGIRLIETPYPKLLYVQKWIKKHILDGLTVSCNAFAYVKGTTHIDNAKQHIGAKELLKIDLVDFFGHIQFNSIKNIFKNCGYSECVSSQLARLCTVWERLPQGAPTSPSISNVIFLGLDELLNDFSKAHDLVYTRYADDLCFSGNSISDKFYEYVKAQIESRGFVINKDKTGIVRGNKRKLVTGLVVHDDRIRVPKRMRREYRKQAYDLIKNGIFEYNSNSDIFNPVYIDEVIGKGQYIRMVEPENLYVNESLQLLLQLKNEMLA